MTWYTEWLLEGCSSKFHKLAFLWGVYLNGPLKVQLFWIDKFVRSTWWLVYMYKLVQIAKQWVSKLNRDVFPL